jgi:GH18 family chitinase
VHSEHVDDKSARSCITGMYARLAELKKTNDLKVLLAVGGWNFGSQPFSDMVGDERLRKAFVVQATKFMRDHGFDGLDLDWVGKTTRRNLESVSFSSRA